MATATLLTARHLVYRILFPLEQGRLKRVHLEDLLHEAFQKQPEMSAEDRAFATYLAYGVVRHGWMLNRLISGYSKIPLEKLTPAVRTLLKMGLFQLYAMDRVPDFAAVSTTLNLAETLKQSPKTRGLMNAILQNFIRQQKPIPTEPEAYFPSWWVARLQRQYDAETVGLILQAQRAIPLLTLRANTLKITVENFAAALMTADIPFDQDAQHAEIFHLSQAVGDPALLPGFREGWFVVQDAASAGVGYFLNPQPGQQILEIGAAPGTKTTHLAALMQNTGQITAVDVNASRLKKLAQNCERLGVTHVTVEVADARTWLVPEARFDRILIDAPCSGTGTLGKHPEILVSLGEADFSRFAETQLKLLVNVFPALKPGGTLVYSTCSIDFEENQQVVQALLAQIGDIAQLDAEHLLLPEAYHDGFYMARLVRL